MSDPRTVYVLTNGYDHDDFSVVVGVYSTLDAAKDAAAAHASTENTAPRLSVGLSWLAGGQWSAYAEHGSYYLIDACDVQDG